MAQNQIEITLTSSDGQTVLVLGDDQILSQNVVSFNWNASFKILWSTFDITVPNATRFSAKWETFNPYGFGSTIEAKFDGFTRFSGSVWDVEPVFTANNRDMVIKCRDRVGLLADGAMNELSRRRVLFDEVNLSQVTVDGIAFGSDDVGGVGTFPWAENYLIPLWLSGSSNTKFRIPFSEYQSDYSNGAALFNHSTIKVLGDDGDGDIASFIPNYVDGVGIPLNDADGFVFGKIPYYDITDESMRISEIMTRAFEFSGSGGLGLIDSTDFNIEATPNDNLNRVDFITDEANGSISDWIASLYDNPAIGLAPSYQVHDFDGLGVIDAKLITQTSSTSEAKDVQTVLGAQFPTSAQGLYSRAVLINNQPNRQNIMRDVSSVTSSPFPVAGFTEFGDPLDTIDESAASAWGFFQRKKMKANTVLTEDVILITYDFGSIEPVDTIALNTQYTFATDDNPVINDFPQSFKKVTKNLIITIEWSPDDTNWFPIHPDLFYRTVDYDGGSAWIIVKNLQTDLRYLRYIVNQPLFAKIGEANFTGQADRAIFYYLTELKVLKRGRVVEFSGTGPPEVKFTDDDSDPNRFLLDLSNTTVDMFRPKLLSKLNRMGYKNFKTLPVEANDVWDFSGSGSVGSKLLVTQLDTHSKQNTYNVQILPQVNLKLGDTVYSSRFNVTDFYTVTDFNVNSEGEDIRMTITLQDFNETNE